MMSNMDSHDDNVVASPCIRHCCLDQNDRCVGCFRTIEEIVSWSSFSNVQKIKVLRECELRKEKSC